jgi:hypothetical protein
MGNCEECRFWVEPRVAGIGECHRHAPVVVNTSGENDSMPETKWPTTLIDDGCGDFEDVPL